MSCVSCRPVPCSWWRQFTLPTATVSTMAASVLRQVSSFTRHYGNTRMCSVEFGAIWTRDKVNINQLVFTYVREHVFTYVHEHVFTYVRRGPLQARYNQIQWHVLNKHCTVVFLDAEQWGNIIRDRLKPDAW